MRLFRQIPLRLLIVLPYSFLFILTAIIFSTLSYHNNKTVANTMGHQFSIELGNRIEAYVHQLIDALPTVVNINADALRKGILNSQKPTTMPPFLLNQLRHFDQITFNTIALNDGRYLAATRPPETPNDLHISANFIDGPFKLTGYSLTPDDMIGEPVAPPFDYDPRTRPFMKCALKDTSQPCWGDIYHYLKLDSFAVSLSQAVLDSDGNIIGVAAADIALKRLSDFMASLDISEGGKAFLTDQNGVLIAISDADLGMVSDDKNNRLALSQHSDELLRTVSNYISLQSSSREVTVNDETYLLDIRYLDLGFGLQWQLGVIMPEHDFIAPVMGKTLNTLLFTLTALFAMALLGILLARLIAEPIEGITAIAKKRALNTLEKAPFSHSYIPEVRGLSLSLAHLAGELRAVVDNLEIRVNERTKELQQANQQLHVLSQIDGLTGVANRRAFDVKLAHEWKLATRNKSHLALIICDIDFFKPYNDHYGHQQGDETLCRVASCLANSLQRPSDLLARYGGEEFVAVLPDTTSEGALALAEQLRQAIETLNIPREDINGYPHITLSFGIASIVPDTHTTPESLLKHADKQLYIAKESGRNQSKAIPINVT